MCENLLELSHRDNSNKWSNIEICKEIELLEFKISILSGFRDPDKKCKINFNLHYLCFFITKSLI